MSKDPISIVQRGNLQSLEKTLRKQWRLGQSIVLCWCGDERGLLVIFVPHYFLGNYCAHRDDPEAANENENYIRVLISGRRRKSRDELFAVAVRLGVSPTFIKLENPLDESISVMSGVEEIIRRYGLSFVERRGVLLFDIADFSLFSSFEQASQLNSLSYSMNSVYNKLAARGMEINFARTTTGDGYYVWNRDNHPQSDQELFLFLQLVLADNSLARAASRGNTVPVVRAAFHIGSHYELYQAEGVNPTVLSYIVGDVTIELARILEKTLPGQVMLGDFGACAGQEHGSAEFVQACEEAAKALEGLTLMGKPLRALRSWLSRDASGDDTGQPLDVTITDKHGIKHHAFNWQGELEFEDTSITLGMTPEECSDARDKYQPRGNGKSDSWWV
ncbi:hypothetical protein [Congregibacter sp.]|uniref:hypothetical protein n=1 Tax=Congregibacter sp. TaxID=2744308 RepID=UPI0039E6DAA6